MKYILYYDEYSGSFIYNGSKLSNRNKINDILNDLSDIKGDGYIIYRCKTGKSLKLKVSRNLYNSCGDCYFTELLGTNSCPDPCYKVNFTLLSHISEDEECNLNKDHIKSVTRDELISKLCNKDMCPYLGSCDEIPSPLCLIKYIFEEP